MRILTFAGEASGDAYAARLMEAVRARNPEAELIGVGGPKLAATGAHLIARSDSWGAIGVAESLKVVPRVLRAVRRVRQEFSTGTPGLFVPIDYGYANVRLARDAKALGWRVLYFVPPGSWRRGPQGKDLPHVTDAIVSPFSWSAEALREAGAEAYWFGHPLLELMPPVATDRTRAGWAVLPGSRPKELAMHLPLLAGAARRAAEPWPTLTFALAAATDPEPVRRTWVRLSGRTDDAFRVDATVDVLAGATFALVCSGTATLQAALCDTPHVIFYRADKAVEFQAWITRFRRPVHFGLPNLLLDERVVPELIQEVATPENLEPLVREALGTAETQRAGFARVRSVLGGTDAIQRTADLAIEIYNRPRALTSK
ncbi:MAG: hypothetical protein SFX74_05625 [Fimbriimonadaceae bacterium]|nr:hypothetical protein [Fimbriimonadaceae bacterium]